MRPRLLRESRAALAGAVVNQHILQPRPAGTTRKPRGSSVPGGRGGASGGRARSLGSGGANSRQGEKGGGGGVFAVDTRGVGFIITLRPNNPSRAPRSVSAR